MAHKSKPASPPRVGFDPIREIGPAVGRDPVPARTRPVQFHIQRPSGGYRRVK